MKGARDMLSIRIEAARKRRAEALARAATEEAVIAELLAKKRALYTRQLRRTAHWPKSQSSARHELEALLAEGLGQ